MLQHRRERKRGEFHVESLSSNLLNDQLLSRGERKDWHQTNSFTSFHSNWFYSFTLFYSNWFYSNISYFLYPFSLNQWKITTTNAEMFIIYNIMRNNVWLKSSENFRSEWIEWKKMGTRNAILTSSSRRRVSRKNLEWIIARN